MKWLLIVVIATAIVSASAKSPTRGAASAVAGKGRKKASSVKPTKTPKSIVEQFRGLPADDLAFIEQLDKQFQLHGEKVKIKVERDNSTQTKGTGNGKNSKRTIDGSLSYGYQQNAHYQPDQYYFTKPRYEIFPYSSNGHGPSHQSYTKHGETAVEITQSQGYEIKEITDDFPDNYNQNFVRFPGQNKPRHQALTAQHQHQPIVQQQEEVPVIVLKVPGPSKYAAHLKTLLQQYLELRAAQVIQELQEQERAAELIHQQHIQQMQYHQQQQQAHVQYATPASIQAQQNHAQEQQQIYYQQQQEEAYYQQQQQQQQQQQAGHQQGHGHAVYGVPSAVQPEESDYLQGEYDPNANAGSAGYDEQPSYVSQGGQHQQYYEQEQEQRYQQQEQQKQQQQLQLDPRNQNAHQGYQNQGHIHYAEEQSQGYSYPDPTPTEEDTYNSHQQQKEAQAAAHHQQQQQQQEPGSHLETPENYPDEQHTRVVFTKNFPQRQNQYQQQVHQQQVQHQQVHAEEPQEQTVVIAPKPAYHSQDQEQNTYPERYFLPTPIPAHDDYVPQGQEQEQEQHIQGHDEQQHDVNLYENHQPEEYQQHQADDGQEQENNATPGPFITITQKRKMNRVPFNYHAHGRYSTPPPRKRETPYTEEEFQKFNKLVNRLKKKHVMLHERTKKSPMRMPVEATTKNQQ